MFLKIKLKLQKLIQGLQILIISHGLTFIQQVSVYLPLPEHYLDVGG
jgi:hypothetical protein